VICLGSAASARVPFAFVRKPGYAYCQRTQTVGHVKC
jgi:hypothetical protein